MRKALLLSVALTVLFATAAPALAQEDAGGVDCDQIQVTAAARSAQGSDGAVDPSKAAAIARELGASQELVEVCLEVGVPLEGVASGNTASAAASSSSSTTERTLPETGGTSSMGLSTSLMGLGALLLVGGQLLRRTVR